MLGVSMGPFSSNRKNESHPSKDLIRPLSRVKFAAPSSKRHRDAVPMTTEDFKRAAEIRARRQPMILHKSRTEKERWLLEVGVIEKAKDLELSMELYLHDKLSEIVQPPIKRNDLRGLDQPKERRMPEAVFKRRAEAAKLEEERLKQSLEDFKNQESERQEVMRLEFEKLKAQRVKEQEEAEDRRALAAAAMAKEKATMLIKRKITEPDEVESLSPAVSEASSPEAKDLLSNEVLFGLTQQKPLHQQQLELDLDEACKGNRLANVQRLLAMCPDGVKTVDVNGNTPLAVACAYGHKLIVELLLKEGSDVNHVNLRGVSPISRACASNHKDIVMLLLKYGADELLKDNQGRCALDYSVERLKGEIQREKIKLVETDLMSQALFSAVEDGDLQRLVSVLVMTDENKVDILGVTDNKSSLGWNPLHLACSERLPVHLEMARVLLRQGMQVGLPDTDGDTALHLACQGSGEVAEHLVGLLLECNAQETRVNKKGRTPLFSVCQGDGSIPIAEQLLVHDAYIRHTDSLGRTCLFYACYSGHKELALLLVAKGARIDVEDDLGRSPLDYCSNEHVAEALIDGRRQRDRLETGNAMLYACNSLDLRNVAACLQNELMELSFTRANTRENVFHAVLRGKNNSSDTAGSTYTQRHVQGEILQMLLSWAGDKASDMCFAPDSTGWSPFHIACSLSIPDEDGSPGPATVLLKLPGAKNCLGISVPTSGDTPLHLALRSRNSLLASLLLSEECPRKIKNKKGRTDLHVACLYGLTDIVMVYLEDHGRLDELQDEEDAAGDTPFMLATGPLRQHLVEYLTKKREEEEERARTEERRKKEERLQLELEEAKARARAEETEASANADEKLERAAREEELVVQKEEENGEADAAVKAEAERVRLQQEEETHSKVEAEADAVAEKADADAKATTEAAETETEAETELPMAQVIEMSHISSLSSAGEGPAGLPAETDSQAADDAETGDVK
jgi:ankyrin repeat protein